MHNSTLGQGLPTPFTVTAGVVSGANLPRASCPLLTLAAIGQTATEDFNGRQPSISFTHPTFTLSVEGRRHGAGLDRKYAVWGLYGALSYMLSHDDFRAKLFTLRWQDSIVGRIRFSERTQGVTETLPQNGNISSIPAPTTISQNTTTLTTRFIDGDIDYYINLNGHPLPESFIYMTIATALVQAAPIPAAEPIHIFDVNASAYNAHLRLTDPNDPPRSSPPFLLKGALIRMLIQIPALMLVENNRWGEADMNVRLDNVMVATGALRRVV